MLCVLCLGVGGWGEKLHRKAALKLVQVGCTTSIQVGRLGGMRDEGTDDQQLINTNAI